MENKQSSFCFRLRCNEDQFPFWYSFLSFTVGLLLGWLLLNLIIEQINATELCVLGYKIHNLYFGALLILFCGVFIIISRKDIEYIMVSFVMGIGFGLSISDLLNHFIYQTIVFSFTC